MRRGKGKVMVIINDHSYSHRVFGEFYCICYSTAIGRQRKAQAGGELIVMNCKSDALEGRFEACCEATQSGLSSQRQCSAQV